MHGILTAALLLVTAPTTTWLWPLPAPHQVLAGFAPPAHDWLPGHRGVDLAARPGETVLAAGAGRVSYAGRIAGVGVVAVRHAGGLETTYEPVDASVHVGQAVIAGQRIGAIAGRLAHCRQTCLHWGLRKWALKEWGRGRGDAYLDPLALVGAERVRLLPLLSHSPDPPVDGSAAVAAALASSGAVLARRRLVRR